jgi:tetratricopeptide (TPR) repeat protein
MCRFLRRSRDVPRRLLRLRQKQSSCYVGICQRHLRDGLRPALRLVTHDVLGDTLYWCGDFTSALEHLEQGIALYRPDEHRGLAYQHAGYDPCVACRAFSAYVLWYLGYPDRALRRIEEGVALARELSQTFSLILAVQFETVVHHLRG